MAYIMMRMRLKSMFSICLPNDLHPDEFEAVLNDLHLEESLCQERILVEECLRKLTTFPKV